MATIVIIIIVIVTIVVVIVIIGVVIVIIVVVIVIITQHHQARPDKVEGLGGTLHFQIALCTFRWHFAILGGTLQFFCCNIGFRVVESYICTRFL